jgi:hypothetical protein
MVEKQYRNRLKMQFEKLLAVLPMRSSNDDDDVDAIAPDHSFSRGEVLDAARRRILSLEKENQQLAVAHDQLMKDIQRQNESCAASGQNDEFQQALELIN